MTQYTALTLGKKIQSGELGAVEATKAALAQIKRLESTLHSFVTVDEKNALKQAEDVQQKIMKGELTGPLAGVPMALKDNLCTEGLLTTCGSKMLHNFIPPYTAQAVQNLREAGAIILGKTNMDEFAMGSTTETSFYGSARNPWNTACVPGGSSGGSCGAVAAEECFYALGTDTGGSIRQPSAFCGVIGLKPTYGTVSRYGLIAYGSSLEQIGPIARDVADCAAILKVMASWDAKDSTSLRRDDYDFTAALVEDVTALKIGIPVDYLKEGIEPEVKAAVRKAAQAFESCGAHVEEFDLGLVDYAIPAYYVIASAEASSNLSRFDGVKYGHRAAEYEGLHSMYKGTRQQGFGSEVKRRIMLGSFVLSSGYYDAYYLKALRVRTLIKQEFDKAFEKYDIILGPTAPTTAPRLGELLAVPMEMTLEELPRASMKMTLEELPSASMKMYLGDVYTVAANLAGLPAISIPCGTDSKGLPIGLQLIGNCFEEKKIIRAAYTFEMTRGYQRCPMAMEQSLQGVTSPKTSPDRMADTAMHLGERRRQ